MLKHDVKKGIAIHQKTLSHRLFNVALWLPLPIAVISASKVIYQKHFMNLIKNVSFNNFINKLSFISVPMLITSSLLIIPKILQLITQYGVSKAVLPASFAGYEGMLKSRVENSYKYSSQYLERKRVREIANEFYDNRVKHPTLPNEYENSDLGIKNKFYTVTTHDGAKLDSFIFTNKAVKNDEAERYIVHFNGNGELYQLSFNGKNLEQGIARPEQIISDTICHTVMFNYRGTGNSTGNPHSYADLVNDGIAQIDHLLKQGIKPENIELYGHSMGGGIAPHVAMHFHKRGVKLGGMIISRTYSDLVETAKHILPLGSIVRPVVTNSGWDNNVIDTVIELSQNNIPISIIDITRDAVIGEKGLAKEIKKNPKYKGQLFTSGNIYADHNTPLASLGANDYITEHFTGRAI